jgi:hypothetical protein
MLHSAPDRRLSTITVSQRGSSGNASDDAQAFFVAGNITDFTQQTAINYLIDNLKNEGLWTKMKVIYPLVGGNATAHALNLKNISQFPLTFSGITHSSGGISGTTLGVASSAISSYTSVADSPTDTSFGYYGTTNFNNSNGWIMGDGVSSAAGRNGIGVTTSGPNTPFYSAMGGTLGSGAIPGATGFLGGNGFKVVSILGGTARTATNQIELAPFTPGSTVSGLNWRLIPSATGNTVLNTYSFFFVGNGLTSAEILTLHNIVGAYQGILGRSLYTFDVTLHPWTNRFKFISGLTDSTQIFAVNQLINSLNNNGWLDTNILYVYPFVGTDLTKYAYAIDGSAGVIGSNTYSTLGLDPNNIQNAGISTAIFTSTLTASGGCIGFYCNENTTSTGYDTMCSTSTTLSHIQINLRNVSDQILVQMYTGGTITTVGTNTNSIGSYHLQIPAGLGSSFSSTLYKNGTPYGTNIVHGTTAGAGNFQRVPGSYTNSSGASRRFAISYIGLGVFNASQVAILNNIIQTYVTTLGRQ